MTEKTIIHDSFAIPVHIDSNSFKKFAKRGYKINIEQKRPFWWPDFEDLGISNSLYRKYIEKIKSHLEEVGNSKPKRWKFKGLKLTGDSHRLTLNPMNGINFLEILEKLRYQELYIHDIKVKLGTTIHELLLNQGMTPRKENKLIKIDFPYPDNNITTKISVYPRTVQIDIGCTYKPLIYDTNSLWLLHELLSKIGYYLESLCKNKISLPPVHEWIITHYHLNKDGSDEYSGEAFNFIMKDFNLGIIRFYSKDYPNNKTKLRLEKIETPQNPIMQEMNNILLQKVTSN